jgi:hypothetical protein
MDAVASFAEEIALFGLAFFVVVFFELVLPTRDFFVIAMLFPQKFGFESRLRLSRLQPACQSRRQGNLPM